MYIICESLRWNFLKVYKVLGLANLTSTSRISCLIGIRVQQDEYEGGASVCETQRQSFHFSLLLYNQIIRISIISIIVIHADLFVCFNLLFFFFWALNNFHPLNTIFSILLQNETSHDIDFRCCGIINCVWCCRTIPKIFYYTNNIRVTRAGHI